MDAIIDVVLVGVVLLAMVGSTFLFFWALIDCAKRPGAAWTAINRRQWVWLTLIVVFGVFASIYYLAWLRPQLGGKATPRKVQDSIVAVVFLSPALFVFYWFYFRAIYKIFELGLYQQNRTGTRQRWVGFSQYTDVLTGDDFKEGAWITIKYVLFTVPPGLILGILLAVAVNRKLKGIKVFQGIFSSTIASSVAVASVIFFVLINPQVGVFKVDWLSNPDWALFGVSLSSVWQNLGLTFIIVLAGLQAVPEEVMESATLDGAGAFRKFFNVTLPLISPTLLFLVVVLTIFAFQAFAQIDILTAGGPAQSTETLVFKIFKQSQEPVNLGTASVLSIGLFGLTFLVSVFQFAILDRRVHYGRK